MYSQGLYKSSMVLSLLMVSILLSAPLFAQVQNKRVKPPIEDPAPPGPEGSYVKVPLQAMPEENIIASKKPNQSGPSIMQGPVTSPFTNNIPVIDGVISPGEWTDAYNLNIGGISSSYYTGGTYCWLKIKNTCTHLYIAAFNQYGTSPNTMGSGTGLQNFFNFYFDTFNGGDYTYCSYGPVQANWEKMFTFPDAAGYPIGGGSQTAYLHGNKHYNSCFYTWWLAQRASDDSYANNTSGVQFARTTSAAGTYFEISIDFLNSKLQMPYITSAGSKLRAGATIGYDQGAYGYLYGMWWNTYFYLPVYSYNGYSLTNLFVTGPPPGFGGVVNIAPVTLNTTDFVWRSNQSIQWSTNVDATPNQALSAVTEVYGTNTASATGPLVKTQTDVTAATAPPSQAWNVTVPLSPPTLVTGFYDLYAKITFTGTCGPVTQTTHWKIFVAQPGEGICYVWPGDVNNNNTCNLADRQALSTYLYDANTRPTWLNGPVRFRTGLITGSTTPLDIFTWVQQPSKMWQTPQGCFMDADGNGTVNNLDLFALKFNLGKTHTFSPKSGNDVNLPTEFTLAQNYPNPFNPTTNILYDLPEESFVNLKITDVLGRDVKVLVNETVAAGAHSVIFNAVDLPSGVYYYAITAHGLESGSDFTRSLKMSLTK